MPFILNNIHKIYLRQIGLFLILLAWLLGHNAFAIAGILTIEIKTSVTIEGDLLKVDVTATNRGNEPAYNVQIHSIVLDEKKSGPIKNQLTVDQSDTVVFKRALSGAKKGRHPLIVLVDFYDANQYPFSAVSCTTFYFKEDINPDLVCLGNDTSIEDNGLLSFKIKNLELSSRNIQATLILPKELSTPNQKVDLKIDPRAEKMVSFDIHNFSALSGATYPAFCYFEYDLGDTHYTAVAGVSVTILKNKDFFKRTKWRWVMVTVILILIPIIMSIRNRGKSKVFNRKGKGNE